MYLAGVDETKQPWADGYGVVFSTRDADHWTPVAKLRNAPGPIALKKDTLYVFSDSLYMVVPAFRSICKPEPLTSDPSGMGDMVFLRDTLYAMYSLNDAVVSTYRIDFDGTVTELFPRFGRTYGGSKFITVNENGAPTVYVRGHYYNIGFYRFDGRSFTPIRDGLTDEEFYEPPTNSMTVRNDTLFAGFRYPGSVKFLKNDRWYAFTDSMPRSVMYDRFRVRTEPTAIAFAGSRLFAATSPLGVLQWSDTGWVRISDGLPMPPINGIKDMYKPVVHLVFFNNKLLVGYGEPGYAPWGNAGMYVLPLSTK